MLCYAVSYYREDLTVVSQPKKGTVHQAVVCAINGILASGIATYLAGLPLSGQWCSTMAFLVSWQQLSRFALPRLLRSGLTPHVLKCFGSDVCTFGAQPGDEWMAVERCWSSMGIVDD